MHANAGGIAVEWISDKLYYYDKCYDHIGVLDLATNLYKTIVNDTNAYYYHYYDDFVNIVVDPTTRLGRSFINLRLFFSYICS